MILLECWRRGVVVSKIAGAVELGWVGGGGGGVVM